MSAGFRRPLHLYIKGEREGEGEKGGERGGEEGGERGGEEGEERDGGEGEGQEGGEKDKGGCGMEIGAEESTERKERERVVAEEVVELKVEGKEEEEGMEQSCKQSDCVERASGE